jgi:hypothetical protein
VIVHKTLMNALVHFGETGKYLAAEDFFEICRQASGEQAANAIDQIERVIHETIQPCHRFDLVADMAHLAGNHYSVSIGYMRPQDRKHRYKQMETICILTLTIVHNRIYGIDRPRFGLHRVQVAQEMVIKLLSKLCLQVVDLNGDLDYSSNPLINTEAAQIPQFH